MSIIRGIIQGFIGEWGVKMGDWYFANSLWINGALLFYALLIYIARKNYQTVTDFLLQSISDEISPNMKTWSKSEISKNIKHIKIPWDDARKKAIIPLFAKSDSYFPRLISIDQIKNTYSTDFFIESLKKMNIK
ncbi:MAG: hypothetical protein GX640_23740 [Fibrobacter sp.]|nr:hypothetical protein [Fibrobacter sp.]